MGQDHPKKRLIIEIVADQLKIISYIEHSIHRSIHGLIAHALNCERSSLSA